MVKMFAMTWQKGTRLISLSRCLVVESVRVCHFLAAQIVLGDYTSGLPD